MLPGIDVLPSDVKAMIVRRVVMFSEFTADNNLHGEHDLGSFEFPGRKFVWLIFDSGYSQAVELA